MKINLISILNNTKESFDLDDSAIFRLYRSTISVSKKATKEIEQGLKNKEYKKIEDAAHTLKGASGSIRLDEIYSVCTKLENYAKESKDYDYKKELVFIKNYFKDLENELNKAEQS